MEIPPYVSFLSGDNLVSFWEMVKWFLFAFGSVIMIFLAVEILTFLIEKIKEGLMGEKNDDDDDYDVHYW